MQLLSGAVTVPSVQLPVLELGYAECPVTVTERNGQRLKAGKRNGHLWPFRDFSKLPRYFAYLV